MRAVPLPVPEVGADRARTVAREVLGREEFQPAEPGPLQRAWRWVLQRIADLLDQIPPGQGRVLAWVAAAVLLAVLALVAVALWRRVRSDPGAGHRVEGQVGRPAVDWLAEAEGHQRAGRLRDALRCHYRAVVADLAAGGLVDEVPGRTTGEYLAEVRTGVPAAGDDFASLTRAFEASWYGREPVDESGLGAAVEAGREVRRAAGRPVAVPAVHGGSR